MPIVSIMMLEGRSLAQKKAMYKAVTDALRADPCVGVNGWCGGRGRLKSQMIDGAEYPPFFFEQDGFEAVTTGSIQ